MEGKGTGHSLRRYSWKRLRHVLLVFLFVSLSCISYAFFQSRQVYTVEVTPEDSLHIYQQENEDDTVDVTPEDSLHIYQQENDDEPKRRSDELRTAMKRTCTLLNISIPINNYHLDHIHIDVNNKVLYCYVPKVACTSWKRIWMKLTGVVEPTTNISTIDRFRVHSSLPTLLSPKYKNSVKDILTTYKKFMFTRHPFDRVLSAFKDKLESEDKKSSYSFHYHVGQKIEMKYRGHTKAGGHNVTFSEFIRFISEPGHGSVEQRNEHWLPVLQICNPCSIDYDFIGKYDNLKEDAEYVLKWLGVSNLVGEFPSSDRPFHARRYEKGYFDQLSYDERVAFFSKYLTDFLAFGYDFL
ncbi:carbohydrate sulfotransferase 12-like isoform X4 [Oratosquilla oratoria]|uniref:carbohydrate sulfotransferase 12-like isoform X4 n=1 Tax=Oratosquilla oratoria TaxID=337810 RepID=UPI003F75F234